MSPTFQFFSLYGQAFHRKTPKWPWPTLRSKVPHIHVNNHHHRVPIFIPSRFRVIGHWAKCTELPQMTLNNKGQRYPIYILKLPWFPNFTPFRSTASRCRVTGHCETSALIKPKITLTTKGSKVSHIHVTTTSSHKFHSVSLYSKPLSSYRPFWDKFSEWPKGPRTLTESQRCRSNY